ncbi:hypothetical protein JA33_051 [Dickeya phage vB_DsoM_JA33]|uniref:Uncharacterized protein n=2 Tax=Salmondvirus JA11 TaxID=2734141 RepID=A0A386K565_9CAUD|nr:hypothetical protein HOU32_gp051 [Dickeya phage vB_DsoM_JA11]AXG67425.1 hypothetical protein JA33_051 [Dickeya phage vB_DsoM_JA33]AYD79856.1 hypothetical protein JA11_051 [Dickeya phage vB_DsoM_JA11]
MEKNSDKRIVVMDIEMFARLMEYANIGEFEAGQITGSTLAEIKRHVNKQNTFLGEARTRTALEEGKERKKISEQLKRKARYISLRKTVKFYYAEGQRLIPVTLGNNSQWKKNFHNWGHPQVSINVILHYPVEEIHTRIRITDLLCDPFDNEYIANLINNEGYVKEELDAQEDKIC